MNDSVESVRRQKARRITAEGLLIAILLGAIAGVLALPAESAVQRANETVRESGAALFQITESDFLQPKFASARAINALNRLSSGFASFGGYDEFTSCVRLRDGASIANVTRIAGDTLSLLNVQFILRAVEKRGGMGVYISEGFWERAFHRNVSALGSTFALHGVDYRVLGITRELSSLLAKTDVWLPVPSRGISGDAPYLRIIGVLQEDVGWHQAQKQLLKRAAGFRLNLLDDLMAAPRLIPLDRGIYFGSPAREWLAQVLTPGAASSRRAG